MKATQLRIIASNIENNCPVDEVYGGVAKFLMDEDVGMFLADSSDPFQGLTRDETATGLYLAAAYADADAQ